MVMSLKEYKPGEILERAVQITLEAFDTPERRERITSDIERAFGPDGIFPGVLLLKTEAGKVWVTAEWKKGKLVVKFPKVKK